MTVQKSFLAQQTTGTPQLSLTKPAFVAVPDLIKYYVPSSDGNINFEKLQGGNIFTLLNKYLKERDVWVVAISDPCFKNATWNDCKERVLLVKKEANLPIELRVPLAFAVEGYHVINQKKLSDYLQNQKNPIATA